MTSTPFVSLVVVTYDSAPLLPGFFAALASTRYAPYEIVVVDNASRDGTRRVVGERCPEAVLLANAGNVGFGRACNRGARAARGELLVFLNADVLVTPGWLATLVRRALQIPDAAVVSPATLYPDETRPPAEGAEDVAAVPGCAMLVRRAAWEALDGFDERMFLYWEDTDLCWRAWLHGWRVLVDRGAIVYHARGGSGGGPRWDAERAKNGLYTHLKLMRWRRVVPFAAVLAAKTVGRLVLRGDPRALLAWRWNCRHLAATLATRQALRRDRRLAPAALEQRVREHEARTRRERRARRAEVACV